MQLNAGKVITLAQHWTAINDEALNVISRTSALQVLSYTTQSIPIKELQPDLTHNEAPLRLSAASASLLIEPKIREHILILASQSL